MIIFISCCGFIFSVSLLILILSGSSGSSGSEAFFASCMAISFIGLIMSLLVATQLMSSKATTIYYRPIEITKDADTLSTIVKYVYYSKPYSDIDFENIKSKHFANNTTVISVINNKEVYLSPVTNLLVKMNVGKNIYGKILSGIPRIDVCLRDIKLNDME